MLKIFKKIIVIRKDHVIQIYLHVKFDIWILQFATQYDNQEAYHNLFTISHEQGNNKW